MSTEFEDDRDHAPIDSEIFALLDSIGASYLIKNGIVTVVTKYGDTWSFTEPKPLLPKISDEVASSAYRALFETPAHEAHLVKANKIEIEMEDGSDPSLTPEEKAVWDKDLPR